MPKFKLPSRADALDPLADAERTHEVIMLETYSRHTANALKAAMAREEYSQLIRNQRLNDSQHDRMFTHSLIDDTSITCKPADKNLGLVLVDTAWYDAELRKMLADRATYARFSNPVDRTRDVKALTASLYEQLQALVKRHELTLTGWNPGAVEQVTSYMASKIGKTTAKVPEIYLLIKVHKPKGLCGRPIVPCTRWITTPASVLADHLLQEIVNTTAAPSMAWLVKDTKSFVNELEHTHSHGSATASSRVLLTADISSLYTNIDTKLGLRLVREFLVELAVRPALIELIMDLLSFVMNNSYLSYRGQVYKQIDGTAMGTTCAPIYANIVVYQLERSVIREFQLERGTLHLYRRYLDDIFADIDARDAERFKQRMNALHPKLFFEFASDPNEAAFLDLHISKGRRFHEDGRFDLRVHQKKMNLYLYIPYLSFHTDAAKKSFIQTELMRYIRNTSDQAEYNELKAIFYQRLRDRGYPHAFLNGIFASIFYADRDWFLLPAADLIRHAEATCTQPLSTCLLRRISRVTQAALWTPNQQSVPPTFIIPYSPLTRILPVRRILCDRWELIQDALLITRPIIAYQSNPSLLVRLVHQKATRNREQREDRLNQPASTIQVSLDRFLKPM